MRALPLALALAAAGPAQAQTWTVSVDLLQEAMAVPTVRGAEILTPPLHPGLQAEVEARFFGGDRLSLGWAERLGGFAHSEIASTAFLSAAPRLRLGLPGGLGLWLDPAEVGVGLRFPAGARYELGEAGLAEGRDPPSVQHLVAAGLGLGWRPRDAAWGLRLSYRAGVLWPAPDLYQVLSLPESTLGLGVSYTPRAEEAP